MAYKLLFVCLGNICRSPTAENVMNHLVEKAGLSNIHCDSAGTSSYHIGSSPDSRMSAAADAILGIKLRGQARAFESSDFENFDLILAMDKENYRNILSMSGANQDKVRLMCDYCRTHSLKEVPDPYYGGKEGFNQVVDLLVDACGGLLEDICSSDTLR
ncbi:low molecular weight protein-tyrosine-phosphatase [Rivularia sp. UHCC 0363]|uniref:low molecular weight protein-tyrosine-phosphatase n=1 Tax=Rivularia sp. UHCC 0363 TaxID=3110244 RepID=UPI002B1F4336|nr:low molecular weight protein-tyrosine-phosphatase [Rivularia sp. UHCC 0363]MEA5596632.1 low molecular weight protein-tyrosine-phosphatase [Rivularia sp. UHCC 0363]